MSINEDDAFSLPGHHRDVPGVGAAGTATAVIDAPVPPVSAAPAPGAGEDAAAAAAPARVKAAAAPRGTAMAAGGQPVGTPPPAPEPPQWPGPVNEDETYVPQEFDAVDLAEVNREMNRARARLFRVSATLKAAQRRLVEAQTAYERQMRRELVTISGGTEASRRAMAEIRCESLENDVVVAKQIVEEWKQRSMYVRDDLKAVENISHNVRAQMDVR